VKINDRLTSHPSTEPVDPEIVKEAQQVHTQVYLQEGFISHDQLNEEGVFVDEYTPRVEPILVRLGSKETTLRMIHTGKKEGGLLSLPTLKHFEIDVDTLKQVAHASRLADIRAKNVVEISGLAAIKTGEDATTGDVLDATRQAYATGLRRSLDQGHSLWVMNVDKRFKKGFDAILGKDAMVQIGEPQEYIGPPTIPVALNPQDVVKSILLDEGRFGEANRDDIRNTLGGVSEKHLSRELIKLLHENEIETTKNSLASKAWNNKKAAFYTTIVGYSALRFLPVGAVDEFSGSVPLYAAIDVGTALTQVGSMELFFKGKNRAIRSLGIVGTAASFMAPYAYFYANGDDYPPYVNAIAAGFAAVGVGLETDRSIRDHKLRKGLEATDIPTV
jgi:hypothetical protein